MPSVILIENKFFSRKNEKFAVKMVSIECSLFHTALTCNESMIGALGPEAWTVIASAALNTERPRVPWILPKFGIRLRDVCCRVSVAWQQLRTSEVKKQWRPAGTHNVSRSSDELANDFRAPITVTNPARAPLVSPSHFRVL